MNFWKHKLDAQLWTFIEVSQSYGVYKCVNLSYIFDSFWPIEPVQSTFTSKTIKIILCISILLWNGSYLNLSLKCQKGGLTFMSM